MSEPTGRLFIAAPLPGKMAQALFSYARACEDQFPGRYVSQENYHVTLAFLGDTPLALVESALEAVLETAAESFGSFRTDFSQTGFFGKKDSAILWCGLKGGERIVRIAQKVRDGLDLAGLSYDRKPTRPHITIARKVDLEGRALPAPPSCEGVLDSIVLYESTRRKGRLTYVPLTRKYLR